MPTSQGPTGMVCIEAPETWFDDTITVPIQSNIQYVPIDPIFCETVEEGSIRVVSTVFDQPAFCGASVLPHPTQLHLAQIRLILAVPQGGITLPTTVTLTIRGTRRGCAGHRFRKFSAAQMERNSAFWQSAHE